MWNEIEIIFLKTDRYIENKRRFTLLDVGMNEPIIIHLLDKSGYCILLRDPQIFSALKNEKVKT